MATIYARLINHFKFENHKLFSAIFHKTDEKLQRINEIDLFNKLNINHNSIAILVYLYHPVLISLNASYFSSVLHKMLYEHQCYNNHFCGFFSFCVSFY